ncbi:type II toxin-antitoxin system VapC family toxin [Silvimonas sp.]|uniref:type II toxin-antitoxin system VapC family toxin n=1 Tax=Silvimonas sp. TaxID=2650811 RepID=UPI0028498745|nr:type II toxin-antitoxin system VapC family toxin [Silvimonas sp.]MDR3428088.1 type II toxin-antitoxin system VapC family toxin [Silvimonas sp.]
MKITADTNVLVRLVMADDETQNKIAVKAIERASLVAISTHSLCEFAWVLDRRYGVPRADIAGAIRGLIEARNVAVNRPAVEAGLSLLDAGGDFADGVIAYDGNWLGGEIFLSFDKKAVTLLAKQERPAKLLA